MATKTAAETEIALQRMVTIYVVTGLLFLVLPGTFLGVWNLVSISGRHSLAGLSQAWLQAHGHAQIFGWIGTFVIGIGYYSLSKMGGLMPVAVSRAWASWALWTGGVTLRWAANVTRVSLAYPVAGIGGAPVDCVRDLLRDGESSQSAAGPNQTGSYRDMDEAGHRSDRCVPAGADLQPGRDRSIGGDSRTSGNTALAGSTLLVSGGLGLSCIGRVGIQCEVAARLPGPSRTIQPRTDGGSGGVGVRPRCGALGTSPDCDGASVGCQHSRQRRLKCFSPPKETRQDAGGLRFVSGFRSRRLRLASGRCRDSACTRRLRTFTAAFGALLATRFTVGFLSTMVFAIGQRVLPAFCGMRLLYSKRLMWASLAILNLGCLLRVASEVPAYEANLRVAWQILPVSAVTELTAVTLFALNLGITLLLPPPYPAVARPLTSPALSHRS